MHLDLETLFFSSALSRAAYLIVFATVAFRQPRETCLWHWIGAIVASMIGSAVMSRVPVTRWLSPTEAFIVYTFYLASLVLSWSGLRLFNFKAVKLPIVAMLMGFPGGVYVAALVIGLSPRMALATVFVFCIAYAVMAASEVLREPSGPRLWSRYIVGTTFGFYALAFALTLGILAGTDIPMNSAESGQMSIVLDQATGILVYFGYIAMAKERAVLKIHQLAETDPLTGLANRRGLQTALERQRGKPGRDRPTGVLLADIDHFKSINDTHGHEAGDMVLVAFAGRLRDALRQEDIVVRWGGEEFIAVLPHMDLVQLAAIAERLRSAVEADPFILADGHSIQVTVSIGVSEMSPGASQFEPATRRADAALYEAKTTGRNRVCVCPRAPLEAISIGCAA